MQENILMADLLLPNITKTPDYYENLYPNRNLPEGARVVRVAPSPTGYLHLGVLFVSLVNRITATSSGGIFFTRIEDTDKKREVKGGIEDIIGGLKRFGIFPDEGFISGNEQKGDYGPYQQSHRAEIYQTYVKELLRLGLLILASAQQKNLRKLETSRNPKKSVQAITANGQSTATLLMPRQKRLSTRASNLLSVLNLPETKKTRLFLKMP